MKRSYGGQNGDGIFNGLRVNMCTTKGADGHKRVKSATYAYALDDMQICVVVHTAGDNV